MSLANRITRDRCGSYLTTSYELCLKNSLTKTTSNRTRFLAQYDAIADYEPSKWEESDLSGHGGHVTGISPNSELSRETPEYRGVAPDASLVVARAFNAEGASTYADVIRGIDWVVRNKDIYDIQVLNLSIVNTREWYGRDSIPAIAG